MMKKPAVALFALLYTLLMVSRSFEHATHWLAETVAHQSYSVRTDSPVLSDTHNRSSHDGQTRILERDYEVEPSSPDSPASLKSIRNPAQTLESASLVATPSGISSRSPPFAV